MTYVGRTVRCLDDPQSDDLATTGDLGVVVRVWRRDKSRNLEIRWFRFPTTEVMRDVSEGKLFEFVEDGDD